MLSNSYCDDRSYRGLTCAEGNLEIIRKLKDYSDSRSEERELIYRCKACQGLYKYIYSARYETRNFDCEEGWYGVCDRYFKVGEIWVSDAPFTIEEARNYSVAYERRIPSKIVRESPRG
jgi:hypothetical protein